MKEVVLEMDIITNFSKKVIIRQNKCQMGFLEKLMFKRDIDKKLMITAINCSMLKYLSTYKYYDTDNGVYK